MKERGERERGERGEREGRNGGNYLMCKGKLVILYFSPT